MFPQDSAESHSACLVTDPECRSRAVKSVASTGARGEPPPHIVPPTRDDVARNDRSLKALPTGMQDLEEFLPELRKKKPEQVLHILSERFSKDPSPANAALVQRAVNLITAAGAVDAHMKGEIAKTIRVLLQMSETHPLTWHAGDSSTHPTR